MFPISLFLSIVRHVSLCFEMTYLHVSIDRNNLSFPPLRRMLRCISLDILSNTQDNGTPGGRLTRICRSAAKFGLKRLDHARNMDLGILGRLGHER